jgi:hypothetical protein
MQAAHVNSRLVCVKPGSDEEGIVHEQKAIDRLPWQVVLLEPPSGVNTRYASGHASLCSMICLVYKYNCPSGISNLHKFALCTRLGWIRRKVLYGSLFHSDDHSRCVSDTHHALNLNEQIVQSVRLDDD